MGGGTPEVYGNVRETGIFWEFPGNFQKSWGYVRNLEYAMGFGVTIGVGYATRYQF